MRRAILIQQHSLQCIYTTKLICLLVSPSLLVNVNACCRYQRQCSCCASSVQVLKLPQPSFIQYLSLSRSNIQVKHSAVFIADILGRDSTWPPSQGRVDCCYFTHCNHAGAFKYNPEVIASSTILSCLYSRISIDDYLVLTGYLKVVGYIQGAMFLSSPPSPYLNSTPRIQMKLILGCNRMMDTTCHYDPWSSLYALLICPILHRPILHRPVNSYISASRSYCSASNARRFLILSMLILLLMIACCWTVSRWFTYGQQWTFRIPTHYHHYHHFYHRDDGATGKVHYRTFNVWGNHGSYAKYCDNVMVTYMEEHCDTKILWHCHWVPWYVFIITSPLPYLVLVFLVLITACSIKSQYFL